MTFATQAIIIIKFRINFYYFQILSFYLAIAVFRRAPKSFTDQRYYSWMVFEYKAKDGKPRCAKFRLVPADNRVETGLMIEQEQRTPW